MSENLGDSGAKGEIVLANSDGLKPNAPDQADLSPTQSDLDYIKIARRGVLDLVAIAGLAWTAHYFLSKGSIIPSAISLVAAAAVAGESLVRNLRLLIPRLRRIYGKSLNGSLPPGEVEDQASLPALPEDRFLDVAERVAAVSPNVIVDREGGCVEVTRGGRELEGSDGE